MTLDATVDDLSELFLLDNELDLKLIAVDMIGAGIGETVLVALGSAARVGCNMEKSPIDAAIVGIVDEGQDGVVE